MNWLRIILLALVGWGGSLRAGEATSLDTESPATRFTAVDVILDTGTEPLAAYQLSFTLADKRARIVGIEGGDPAAFKQPPYYDPKAIQNERAILAAFSTAPPDQLPKGRVRVATIHLQLAGEEPPQFAVKLQVAAGAGGGPIQCTASIKPRETK